MPWIFKPLLRMAGWEGIQTESEPEDLPRTNCIIHGFRVKSMEFKRSSAAAIYISPFFYFPESSLFKSKQTNNEQKINAPRNPALSGSTSLHKKTPSAQGYWMK
jgi:hypothetical protein